MGRALFEPNPEIGTVEWCRAVIEKQREPFGCTALYLWIIVRTVLLKGKILHPPPHS